MGVEIVVKQDNWAKIRANLSLAKKSYVAVGWPSGKPKTNRLHDAISGMTNVQVASLMEHGSAPGVKPHIPARPMLKATMERNKAQLKTLTAEMLKMISEGSMSTKMALDRIGKYTAGEVMESIAMPATMPYVVGGDGWKMDNAPRTKAAKSKGGKTTNPLVKSGHLMNSVSWEVRMRSAHSRHAWDAMTQRRRAALGVGQ